MFGIAQEVSQLQHKDSKGAQHPTLHILQTLKQQGNENTKRGFEIYTSDFDRHTIETIEKCYPNFQQAFIGEIFIPKQGWVKVLMKITEAKIMELFGWGGYACKFGGYK